MLQSQSNWQGERMREAAAQAGLSASEISRRMKRTPAAISKWWSGQRRASIEDLNTYAAIVGVPVDYFITYERRLPENQSIRSKIDRLAAEVEALRAAVEAPEGYKIVYASDGTPVCVQADSSNAQEDIDIAADVLKHGAKAVRELKRA